MRIRGTDVRLATVTGDPQTGLYETYIGKPASGRQLGLHDFSQARAVALAEDFLMDKLDRLF